MDYRHWYTLCLQYFRHCIIFTLSLQPINTCMHFVYSITFTSTVFTIVVLLLWCVCYLPASGGQNETEASGSRQGEEPMQTNTDEPSELPFQLVVKYTDREGATALRVLTQCKEFTYDRREAEKGKGTKEEIKGTKDNTCTCLSFDLYILMELLSK